MYLTFLFCESFPAVIKEELEEMNELEDLQERAFSGSNIRNGSLLLHTRKNLFQEPTCANLETNKPSPETGQVIPNVLEIKYEYDSDPDIFVNTETNSSEFDHLNALEQDSVNTGSVDSAVNTDKHINNTPSTCKTDQEINDDDFIPNGLLTEFENDFDCEITHVQSSPAVNKVEKGTQLKEKAANIKKELFSHSKVKGIGKTKTPAKGAKKDASQTSLLSFFGSKKQSEKQNVRKHISEDQCKFNSSKNAISDNVPSLKPVKTWPMFGAKENLSSKGITNISKQGSSVKLQMNETQQTNTTQGKVASVKESKDKTDEQTEDTKPSAKFRKCPFYKIMPGICCPLKYFCESR